MILKEFEYILYIQDNNIVRENKRLENFKMDKINLITGKNASGKTVVSSYIMFLAQLLRGKYPSPGLSKFKASFVDKNKRKLSYFLHLSYNKVLEENLFRDGELLIERNNTIKRIYSEHTEQYDKFNPPEDKLTVEVRRSEVDYPYLEELLYWGEHLYAFSFGGLPLYQQLSIPGYELLFNDLNGMLDILDEKKRNSEEDEFKKVILKDLDAIGYDIEDYTFAPSYYDRDFKGHTLIIREKGFDIGMSQFLMSAGMYRAFSILVIINHYILMKKPCTLIIDDLGEGLDFDRSSKLTKLLFDKVKDSEIQLIVTSNDRFLMNAVDIKYWNVLDRKGHTVTSYNYENSKNTFEEFIFTKLSNFDFFASEFYKEEFND